jgi:soluble lytic murein transglycosylase-like protein
MSAVFCRTDKSNVEIQTGVMDVTTGRALGGNIRTNKKLSQNAITEPEKGLPVASDRHASKARLQAALKKALACVTLLAMGQAAWACGSDAARSALQAPQVASKFALASGFCAEGQGPVAEADRPAVPFAVSAVLDARAHAQQLSLYDPRPEAPAVLVVPVPVPEAAAAALGAPLVRTTPPAQALRPVAPAPFLARPLKGVGREAAARALALVPEINRVAEAYQIDPLLLHAIAHVESRHNPDAVSHAGAMGLMQVMPATARRFGVTQPHSQLRNPTISLEVSSAYLKTLQKRFDNNLTLVIAAYNAGEGAVEKYGRKVPPYKETQGYVRDVMSHYLLLVSVRGTGARPSRATL